MEHHCFFNGLLKKDGRSRFWIKYSHAGLSLGPMHILMMYGLALQNGNILKTECLESHFMDIPCILFTSNSRHYVITEDSVIAAWPSRSDKESETLQLNDGRIITAKNVRRFNFIDIPKIESLTAIDDGIVF